MAKVVSFHNKSYLLPLMALGSVWDFRAFTTVDHDIFRHHSLLQHTHLRMFSPTSEQTGRFYAEVTDFLLVSIDHTEAILLYQRLILKLLRLLHTKHFSQHININNLRGLKYTLFMQNCDDPLDDIHTCKQRHSEVGKITAMNQKFLTLSQCELQALLF